MESYIFPIFFLNIVDDDITNQVQILTAILYLHNFTIVSFNLQTILKSFLQFS